MMCGIPDKVRLDLPSPRKAASSSSIDVASQSSQWSIEKLFAVGMPPAVVIQVPSS